MTDTNTQTGLPEDCLLGIPELDKQHETYFVRLTELDQVVSDPYKVLDDDEVDTILDILADLRDFVLDHFGAEESLMREMDYDGLDGQETDHERFIDDVVRMEAELMNGSAIPLVKVRGFLHEWFKNHVLEHDKPFAEYYNNNKK